MSKGEKNLKKEKVFKYVFFFFVFVNIREKLTLLSGRKGWCTRKTRNTRKENIFTCLHNRQQIKKRSPRRKVTLI